LGAAAAAQIPLTHRRASSALVFITAHQASGSEAANWSKLAGSGATLVIYMPGRNYSAVETKLKAAGLAGETPCAIISRATTPYQRTHRTTIGELASAPQLSAPTLLVVGEVVRFADPVLLEQEFEMSADSAGNEAAVPAALLKDFSPVAEFGAHEEPLA
jgi:siroheme synthase